VLEKGGPELNPKKPNIQKKDTEETGKEQPGK
jgi:hypothetical protein